jgi:hypothetical protein
MNRTDLCTVTTVKLFNSRPKEDWALRWLGLTDR